MSMPFRETKLTDGRFARLFEANVDDTELGWHRDREYRVVEVIRGGGWSFQTDNELPHPLQEGDVIEIPALEWHRVIRGEGDLLVAVEKLTLEEAKRRKVRSSYLKGTRKSNKEMRGEIDKCAKEPRPPSCYKDWEADKSYRKSGKAKRNPRVKSEAMQLAESRLIEENIMPIDDVIAEAVLLLAEAKLSEKTRKALKNKAEKSNAPLGALTAVYRKGLAAWLTGHRQGVSQHQWAMGRVNSFLSGGKARKVDKTQWTMVQRHRSK